MNFKFSIAILVFAAICFIISNAVSLVITCDNNTNNISVSHKVGQLNFFESTYRYPENKGDFQCEYRHGAGRKAPSSYELKIKKRPSYATLNIAHFDVETDCVDAKNKIVSYMDSNDTEAFVFDYKLGKSYGILGIVLVAAAILSLFWKDSDGK